MGVSFWSWFWLIGARLIIVIASIVCTAFCIYEGKSVERRYPNNDDWYWTF